VVAIRIINNYKNRQCQGVHRQQESNKRSGYWSKATTTDSVSAAIGVTNEQEADSAIVAICENNKQQSGRDQATGPPEQETLQEWKGHCGHHTGSGRDMDSAIVAIQHKQARGTDSAYEAIGTTQRYYEQE
jgi:hypothetical protein